MHAQRVPCADPREYPVKHPEAAGSPAMSETHPDRALPGCDFAHGTAAAVTDYSASLRIDPQQPVDLFNSSLAVDSSIVSAERSGIAR